MSERDLSPTDMLHEELVAYLDGELDAASVQRVEQRLAQDPACREHLKQLQRAWDVLEMLPKSHASPAFTKTTVEMIAVNAATDVDAQRTAVDHRRRWAWLVGGGSLLASAIAGYGLLASILSAPQKQFLRDLPVIQNVDLYRHAESIEFLKMLDQENLFTEELNDAS